MIFNFNNQNSNLGGDSESFPRKLYTYYSSAIYTNLSKEIATVCAFVDDDKGFYYTNLDYFTLGFVSRYNEKFCATKVKIRGLMEATDRPLYNVDIIGFTDTTFENYETIATLSPKLTNRELATNVLEFENTKKYIGYGIKATNSNLAYGTGRGGYGSYTIYYLSFS